MSDLDYKKLWLQACKAYDTKNPSGCVCSIDEDASEVRSPCALHERWLRECVRKGGASLSSDELERALSETVAESISEARERIAQIRRTDELKEALVLLIEAYKNRHSPQHRAAALNNAECVLRSNAEFTGCRRLSGGTNG